MALRILYAEDEASLRELNLLLLPSKLAPLDVSIIAVPSGEELYEFGKTNTSNKNYDLFITDMNMGPMNGYEALRQLRAQGISTPTIVYSGQSLELERRALELLEVAHIQKPNHNDLVSLIRKFEKDKTLK